MKNWLLLEKHLSIQNRILNSQFSIDVILFNAECRMQNKCEPK